MPKVLIVEDNEMNRDMLSRRLERRGYEVLMALDGLDGLEIAASEMPDIILMDLSLPVMNGTDATRHLKANPATREIPIIALTAFAMASERGEALNAGCDDYDTKPIEIQRLIGKMHNVLNRCAAHAETVPFISVGEL